MLLADLGDAGGAANQHDIIHLGDLDVGVLHHLLHGIQRLLDQVDVKLQIQGSSNVRGRKEIIDAHTTMHDIHLLL